MKKKLSKKQIGKASDGNDFGLESSRGPIEPEGPDKATGKDEGNGGLKPKSGLFLR